MICAIVLAAGRSVRMGTQKLLLPLGSKALIGHIVDEVLQSPIQHVFVIVGRDEKPIREALGTRLVSYVQNLDSEGDMLSSVRCGLRALPRDCEAALIVLGDQPGITPELISHLTQAFSQNRSNIVVPDFNGKRGHPLLIPSRFFDELLHGCEEVGLHGLLIAHPSDVYRIPAVSSGVLADLDTPEDYERFVAGVSPHRDSPSK